MENMAVFGAEAATMAMIMAFVGNNKICKILTFAKCFVIEIFYLYLPYEKKRRLSYLKNMVMKKVINTLFVLAGLSVTAFAQKEKLEDFDEVVIKKKGSNGKVSLKIEINNDDVKINDKPISNFFNDDVTVKIRKRKMSNGASGGGTFNLDSDDVTMNEGPKKPLLGVVTTENEKGALIEDVNENSAAEKMGLKEGDIITKVNDIKITSPEDLSKAIQTFKPNDEVTIAYLNDGKTKTTKGKLGAKSNKQFIIGNNNGNSFDMGGSFDMKSLQDMMQGFEGFGNNGFQFKGFGGSDNAHKIKLGVNASDIEGEKGVKINGITEGSPAEKAGLKVGDVISEINSDPIFTTKDLKSTIRGLKEGDELKVKYRRAGKDAEVKVLVPKKIETIDF
jgi:serine protease Do